MNKKLSKVEKAAGCFTDGFVSQITETGTVSLAAALGLYQGFKYNGNVLRGVKAGAIVLVVMGTVNGLRTISKNWSYIQQN